MNIKSLACEKRRGELYLLRQANSDILYLKQLKHNYSNDTSLQIYLLIAEDLRYHIHIWFSSLSQCLLVSITLTQLPVDKWIVDILFHIMYIANTITLFSLLTSCLLANNYNNIIIITLVVRILHCVCRVYILCVWNWILPRIVWLQLLHGYHERQCIQHNMYYTITLFAWVNCNRLNMYNECQMVPKATQSTRKRSKTHIEKGR